MPRYWWIGAFVALSIAGCFEPNFEDRHIKCGPGGTCPPGLTCGADNLCSLQGGTHDAGDTTKPAAPTLTAVSPVSPANNNNPMVTGNAEAGSTVDIYGDAACTMHLASGTAAELSSPGIRVAISDDTTYAFAATATDAANNVSPCSTSLPFVEDSTPPPAPALVSTIPASPSRSVVPTVHGTSDNGATITLYNTADCTGPSSGNGTADSAGAFAVIATVSPAVVTTISGTAKDAAGNVSACSTTLTYEQNASAVGVPTLGATVPASPSNSVLNPMITGTAEAGVTVKLFTNPSCSGSPVATGVATVANTYSIQVNVSANTTTTYYALATDTSVNQSSQCSAASITYQHDSTPPQPPVVLSSSPVSPSNSTMPTINGSAEAGSKVQLYTDSNCTTTIGTLGTTAVNGTFAVQAPGVSAPTTFYATAKDPAGNTSACSGTSLAYNYDATPPAAPVISPTTTPASPSTNNNTPFVTITAESGATIHVFSTSNCMGGQTASGVSTGSPLGIQVTVASNSSTQISSNATDVAGNTSTCSNSITYVHDSLAPAPPVITTTNPTSPANGNSPMIQGTSEMGSVVQLYTDSGCGSPIGTSQTASAGTFSIAISVSDNTVTTLYTKAQDTAGNFSTCSPSAYNYTEDSAPPAAPTLNSLPPSKTVTTPTLTGTAEAGATVNLYASNNCTGSVAATTTATGGTYSAMVTVSSNSQTPFSAKAVDPAGNASGCSTSFTYIHDTMPPNAPTSLASTPPPPSNDNNPTITGMAEPNSTVRLYTNLSCSTSVAGTAQADGGGAFSIPISVASDSITTFYAQATDAAGNTGNCSSGAGGSVQYTEDSTNPNPPSGFMINPTSPSNNATPTISGTSEGNASIKLYTNSGCTGSPAATGTANGAGAWSIPNVTVTLNGSTTFWGTATDAATNVSVCSPTSISYVHDNVKPSDVTISGSTPGTPANVTNPLINGSSDPNVTVQIFTTSNCSGAPLATGPSGAGNFSISVNVTANQTTNLYANALDSAGNTSQNCSSAFAYVEDQTPPTTPNTLATNPVSPVNNNNPSITGKTDPGATVKAYTIAGCSGSVAGTATANGTGDFSIPVTVVSNTTTVFYLKAFDAASNGSGCTAGVSYTEDSTPPSTPTLTVTVPASPSNNNNPVVNGTGDPGSTVTIYTGLNCASGAVGSGTVAGNGTFMITLTTALPSDTQSTLYANSNDAANNFSGCSNSIPYLEDSTPPDITGGALATNPVTNSNANSPAITGNTEANALVRIYTDNACGTQVASGSANGAGAFSVVVNVADNTTTTFWVVVSDAATNASSCSANSITYQENSTQLETPVLTSTTPVSPSNSNTSPTINGTTKVGYNIELFTNSGCTGAPVGTLTNSASVNFGIGVTVGADTTTTFYAKANQSGNFSGCSNGVTYVHDGTPPNRVTGLAVLPVGPANNNNPFVSGNSEASAAIKLYSDSGCSAANLIGSGNAAVDGTFSFATNALTDNVTYNIYAKATDAAGNTSLCSLSTVQYIEDSLAPNLPIVSTTTPASPSNSNTSPTVNGTTEANATVKIYSDATCTGSVVAQGVASGTSFSIGVSVSANTTTTFKATATDAAGNTSGCSTTSVSYTHDSSPPTAPTGLAMSPAALHKTLTPSVTGTAEAGSTVSIYTTSNCTGTVAGSGVSNGTFSASVTVTANSVTTFYAKAVDAAGNPSTCSAAPGVTYTNDSNPPAAPVFSQSTPTSPNNTSTTPMINGTAEAGSTVKLYSDNTCTTQVGASQVATGGSFSISETVTANQSTSFWAKTTDVATNPSPCTSTPFVYTHDTSNPATPTGVATSPATTAAAPKNFNTPSITGSAEAGATVQVFTTMCTGAPAATGTSNGSFSIPVTVGDNTNTTFYVKAVDPAGNSSACTTSPGVTYYEDSTPPTVPTLTSLNPTSPHNTTTTQVSGSTGEGNATIKLYTDNQCTSAVIGTGTSTGAGGFAVNATVPAGQTTTIWANATDVAGNTSGCSTTSLTYIMDNTPPTVPFNLSSSPTPPSNNKTPMISGSTDPSVTVKLYITSNCSGTVYGTTTATASGGFSITSAAITPDVTTTFYAAATDAATNTSACSAGFAYQEDQTANAPVLSNTTNPTSPSNSSTTPIISGTGEAFSTVKIFANSTCNGANIASTSINSLGQFSVTVNATANATTTYSAYLIDQATNQSACSNSITFTNDQTTPTAPTITAVTATDQQTLHVTWSAGSDTQTATANLRYDICWKTNPLNSCVGLATSNPGDNAYNISGLTKGTRYYVYVRTLDQANNASAFDGPQSDRTWTTGTITQIAAGYDFSCALIADGTVRCWGGNTNGQLGDGASLPGSPRSTTMTPVSGLVDIVQIAVGGSGFSGTSFACARQGNGYVYCWGANDHGQLGNATNNPSSTPVQVQGLNNAASIGVGSHHACAVLYDGTAKCWGYGTSGQLGNNGNTDSNVPVVVSGLTNAMTIDGGLFHTCALLADGNVKCWGSGSNGRLGNGGTATSLVPVAVTMGSDHAKQLDVGQFHACFVTNTGQMRCWGANLTYQLGTVSNNTDSNVPTTVTTNGTLALTNVIGLAVGGAFQSSSLNVYGETCAILSNGTMSCFGFNQYGEVGNGTTTTPITAPATVSGATNVISASVGQEHMCFLMADGTAKCVGNGGNYRLGNAGTGNVSTAVAMAAMYGPVRGIQIATSNGGYGNIGNTSCALLSDGTVKCWGLGTSGQRGDNDAFSDSALPATPVVDSGNNPILAKYITVGNAHACAVTADGHIDCWGSDANGQLGDNDSTLTPKGHAVQLGLINETIVSAGQTHTCSLAANGQAYCWGDNTYSAVGNGASGGNVLAPSSVSGTISSRLLGAHGFGGCVVAGDGTMKCWGWNGDGGLGDATQTDRTAPVSVLGGVANVTKISSNRWGVCELSCGGAIHCAGYGASGEMGNNTSGSINSTPVQTTYVGWQDIGGGGEHHTCARWYNGQLYCWGSNAYYQIGDNTNTNRLIPTYVSNLSTVKAVAASWKHTCALTADGLAMCWGNGVSGSLGDNDASNHTAQIPKDVVNFP